jgi:hypothetical protein
MPEGARLSDIDMTAAARAAASLPPKEPGRSGKPKGLIVALVVLLVLGVIATLWLLDLRDEYLHRQKLADLRQRDETSTRFQLASLLFGTEERAPEQAPERRAAPPARDDGTAGDDRAPEERDVERGAGDRSGNREDGEADTGAGHQAIDDNPFGEEPTPPAGDAPAEVPARPPDQLSELLEGADAVDGDELRADRDQPTGGKKPIVLEGEQFNKLPERPSRAQVKAALDAVAGAVKRCGRGGGGKMLIRVQVAGFTGRVTGAQVVSEEHQGTSAATCAARAVRAAKFPKFSKDSISIKYPFEL